MHFSTLWIRAAVTVLPVIPHTLGSPSSPIISSYKNTTDISKAAAQWVQTGTCPHDFFRRTSHNFKAAGISEWYSEIISKLKTDYPDLYEEMGEVSLFALEAANVNGFNCTSQTDACEQFPTCESVAKFLESGLLNGNEKLTPEEILDITRKTLFSLELMNDLNKWFHNMDLILLQVLVTLQGKVGEIIQDFTRQPDLDAEKQCVLVKRLYEFAINFVKNMNSVAWNIMTQKKIIGPTSPLNNVPSPSSFIDSVLVDLPMLTAEVKDRWKEMDAKDAWDNYEQSPGGPLRMEQTYLHGICSSFGGEVPDENYKRFIQMSAYMPDLIVEIAAILTHMHDKLMHGDPSSEHSLLASRIDAHEVREAVAHLKNNRDVFIRNMTRGVEEIMISSALSSSKCYLKCQVSPNIGRTFCIEKAKNKESRYCPKQNPNHGCELRCVTTQEDGNHEIALVGEKHLRKHGLTLTKLAEHVYENYLKYGNTYLALSEMAGTEMLVLDRIAKGDVSMLTLPVCISEHLDIRDPETNDWQFPCSCGDWKGSETQQFYAGLELGKVQRDFRTGKSSQLFERICPWNLRPLPPLTNFLNLCQNNMAFPDTENSGTAHGESPLDTHRYKMTRNASEHCAAMLAEIDGMRPGEANYSFCKESRIAQRIFASERDWVEGPTPFEISHKKQCDKLCQKVQSAVFERHALVRVFYGEGRGAGGAWCLFLERGMVANRQDLA